MPATQKKSHSSEDSDNKLSLLRTKREPGMPSSLTYPPGTTPVTSKYDAMTSLVIKGNN